MRPSRRYIFWQVLRRLTAGVALVSYLIASFGLPLPASAAPKDRSRPYPCMDNPCGCTCAEDCWRHCCCTTPEERWAWAAAHNVQPPDYAERPGAETADRHSEGACPHCHPQDAGGHAPGPHGPASASALHCKGLSTLWVSAGTTPAPSTFAWRPAVVVDDRPIAPDPFASRLSRTPPAPPPR